jgi:hypothetical protein
MDFWRNRGQSMSDNAVVFDERSKGHGVG